MHRRFHELVESSPAGGVVLRRITSLYATEDEIRVLHANERRDAQDQRSRPFVNDLSTSFVARDRQVSAKSRLGEAIRYTLPPVEGLIRYRNDGYIDLDNIVLERAFRPLALNQKTALLTQSLTKATTIGQ